MSESYGSVFCPRSSAEEKREELAETRRRVVAQLHDRDRTAQLRRGAGAHENGRGRLQATGHGGPTVQAFAGHIRGAGEKRDRYGASASSVVTAAATITVPAAAAAAAAVQAGPQVRSGLAQMVRARQRLQPLPVGPGAVGDLRRAIIRVGR